METSLVWNYTADTILHMITKTEEKESCSLGQEKNLCYEPGRETQCLFGVGSLTILDNAGSTVQFSGTSQTLKAVNSFEKRMQLLLKSGLIAGIIPLSMRKGSGQITLEHVLLQLGGKD